MNRINAIVSRGKNRGVALSPHRYSGGHYLVGKDGNTTDCTKKVLTQSELIHWIQLGYGVRMSAPGIPPSLISPVSLTITKIQQS